jgi:hypothetical protein
MRRLHATSAKLRADGCPLCGACQLGKQRRRPTPGRATTTVQETAGALQRDNLHPGQRILVDHFICSTRVRLPNTCGGSPSGKSTHAAVSSLTTQAASSTSRCRPLSPALKQSKRSRSSSSSAETTVASPIPTSPSTDLPSRPPRLPSTFQSDSRKSGTPALGRTTTTALQSGPSSRS